MGHSTFLFDRFAFGLDLQVVRLDFGNLAARPSTTYKSNNFVELFS